MTRNSILNPRHREQGSSLDGATWNEMPIPWRYRRDPHDEVVAVRTAAGLYDISALNIVRVSGADAASVIDRMVPIDVHRLRPGTARLAALVDERGAISDDLMVICDGESSYRLSHGSGSTQAQLAALCDGRRVSWEQDLDIHMLSLQGPRSAAVLQPHIGIELASLPYFEHRETTVCGLPVTVSRGGYSGEQGFELACASKHAVALWDAILEVGAAHGVIPCSWDSLDVARIEAGLLFFPFDMPEGDTTPWEVNLGWAIDADKAADYVGKAPLLAARGEERFFQAGVAVRHDAAVEAGAPILVDGNEAGVVTSATFSRYLMQSLALVHLKPEYKALGTKVEIRDGNGNHAGVVVRTPFYDPQRLRARVQAA
ncbi:aminomethyl transferase family protein [Aromatoleum toluvorans]|uniref:Aminomethyl transferase family protein n=1 Tax=Aromatoleum toluvorans TaxID=92002 RepID=A0ABX1PU52_9RHOO|nr:aminomethyltransferase family protein [Aromatoleum toluvorans]NMG42883.1 aminomethyl transferase family protein [Aromatoleum toluvorans]